jgi:hypothetical protein
VDARGAREAAQGAQDRRGRRVRTAATIGGQQRLKSQCPSLISIYNWANALTFQNFYADDEDERISHPALDAVFKAWEHAAVDFCAHREAAASSAKQGKRASQIAEGACDALLSPLHLHLSNLSRTHTKREQQKDQLRHLALAKKAARAELLSAERELIDIRQLADQERQDYVAAEQQRRHKCSKVLKCKCSKVLKCSTVLRKLLLSILPCSILEGTHFSRIAGRRMETAHSLVSDIQALLRSTGGYGGGGARGGGGGGGGEGVRQAGGEGDSDGGGGGGEILKSPLYSGFIQ